MRGLSALFVFILVIMFVFFNDVPILSLLCVFINLMWQIVDHRSEYFKNYSEQAFRLFL